MRKRPVHLLVAIALAIALALVASGCSKDVSASSSKCIVVYGNGDGDNGANLKKVIYPGKTGSYEDTTYSVSELPCGPRNYLITPPGTKDANGKEVGDTHTPIEAYLKSGARVRIWANITFQLNQDKQALEQFDPVCRKFECAVGGADSNNATVGWNDMLGEVMLTSLQNVGRSSIYDMPDTIWTDHNPALYETLAERMSTALNDEISSTTGQDLPPFCGAGKSSGWDKDHKVFTCSQVNIRVTGVDNYNQTQQDTADAASQAAKTRELNARLNEAAKAKYGQLADYWLGVLDAIAACNGKTACNINVGRPNTQ